MKASVRALGAVFTLVTCLWSSTPQAQDYQCHQFLVPKWDAALPADAGLFGGWRCDQLALYDQGIYGPMNQSTVLSGQLMFDSYESWNYARMVLLMYLDEAEQTLLRLQNESGETEYKIHVVEPIVRVGEAMAALGCPYVSNGSGVVTCAGHVMLDGIDTIFSLASDDSGLVKAQAALARLNEALTGFDAFTPEEFAGARATYQAEAELSCEIVRSYCVD